jgi:glycosyltransferase involved in cell wall biosynthesis
MKKYVIIIPCFNENKVLIQLLNEIESLFMERNIFLEIVVIDDCSYDNSIELLKEFKFKSENMKLDLVVLNYNMGHQEAIRQGLGFVLSKNLVADGFIVMDSDGEDDPKALLELISLEDFEIVFIERGKRYEGIYFKIGYSLYKYLFSLVVGKKITFGNFSMINQQILKIVGSQNFLHYSSFLYKQNRKVQKLKFDRRRRIGGVSKMNQKSLVIHGLYSIFEFSEEILYFLIRISLLFFILDISYASFLIYKKFISHQAILGWTSTSLLNLIIVTLVLLCTIILGFILVSFKKITHQKNGQYQEL